ncbi:Scr1 family TA system antitoxin-like transcriptional regulator [Kibdelosporangium aridum]|uniref:DUF5753 domain-containing protein n=1 Tax=Kibdelosporangium aridum TaxID=2030 RepID=A0A1W2EKV2_KIBAR|nr:Scr1 family TA system antitoxin-like transcriptional regulator [Kibdelosporangium aridum]SMD10313.1 hypothetical protein SAMN05661093_04608 [Kibdelosporangium aridum]
MYRATKHLRIVRIIPFSVGEYEIMTGAVNWLGFSEPEYPDAVYLEYPGGGEWIEKANDVARFVGSIDDAWSRALTVEESAALVREQVKTLEREL